MDRRIFISSKVNLLSIVLGQLLDKVLFIPSVFLLLSVLDPDSLAFSLSALLVGSASTFAGAYFGAEQAGFNFILHGSLIACITFAISFGRFVLVQWSDESMGHPVWWEFLAWFGTFAAGYFGGFLAEHKSQRSG